MKLENILKNNSKIVNERKKEIYSLDNIFNNVKLENSIKDDYVKKDNLELIEYKENIFIKILNSIRNFFRH